MGTTSYSTEQLRAFPPPPLSLVWVGNEKGETSEEKERSVDDIDDRRKWAPPKKARCGPSPLCAACRWLPLHTSPSSSEEQPNKFSSVHSRSPWLPPGENSGVHTHTHTHTGLAVEVRSSFTTAVIPVQLPLTI